MVCKVWFAVVCAFISIFACASTFAQSTAISEKDYWEAVYSAFATTRKVFPRRETETYERMKSGQTTYKRITKSEYHAADKFHTIKEVTDNGMVSMDEMIQIGTGRYCKENSSDWKTSGCYVNPPAPLEKAVESQFSAEKDKDSMIYKRISVSLAVEAGKSEPTKFVTEDILVLNSDGSIRERTITRSILETHSVVSRETRKHEYDLHFKPINAPI